jgi:hypothetical protein
LAGETDKFKYFKQMEANRPPQNVEEKQAQIKSGRERKMIGRERREEKERKLRKRERARETKRRTDGRLEF